MLEDQLRRAGSWRTHRPEPPEQPAQRRVESGAGAEQAEREDLAGLPRPVVQMPLTSGQEVAEARPPGRQRGRHVLGLVAVVRVLELGMGGEPGLVLLRTPFDVLAVGLAALRTDERACPLREMQGLAHDGNLAAVAAAP